MANLTLQGKTQEKYKVELSVNNNTIISDANPVDGGNAEAASPKDLFLSSVAGCKLMTMKMYVDRKGWEVDEIRINMEFDTSRKEDFVINQSIHITSALDEDKVQRIKNIAELCPVAKYMKQGVTFKTV